MKTNSIGTIGFLIIILLCFYPAAWADVPLFINYHGQLTDLEGSPVEGSQAVNFYFYDEETDGSHIWTEQQDVNFSNGIYQVRLGTNSALSEDLFDDNDTLFLEVEIYRFRQKQTFLPNGTVLALFPFPFAM